MKKLCILMLGLSISSILFAQGGVTQMNWLKPEELKALARRPILVVEYSDSQAEISNLKKKLEKAKPDKKTIIQDRIDAHTESDENFRNHFLQIVKDNWKHNKLEDVKVITHEEAKKMVNAKNAKYCLIMLRSFGKSNTYDGTAGLGVEMPVMIIQGSESYGKNVECIGFPILYSSESGGYTKADIKITVNILNNYVIAALKAPKKLDTQDFIEGEVAKNCSLKKSVTLHFNSDTFKDATASDVKSAWPGSVEFHSSGEFLEAYTPESEDGFALFIPENIAEGSIGPIQSSAVMIGRIVVQPSTGEILGIAKSKMGEKVAEMFYKKGHIEDVSGCGK